MQQSELEKLVSNWVKVRKDFFLASAIHGPEKKDGDGWIPIEFWNNLANAESALMQYGLKHGSGNL